MTNTTRFPLDLADRCVKCGLCLPHCPTYGLDSVEGESPRGRIALMQGLATGRLDPAPALVRHLDRCLGCRACEQACPADVPYGELIDAGRALLAERGIRPAAARRMLGGLVRRPAALGAAVWAARLPGAAATARALGGWPARAAALLPADARPPRAGAAGAGAALQDEARETVLLFAGCISRAVDGRTLDDTRRVLEAAGRRVLMPSGQGCCGALDLHAGRPAQAGRLAERNLAAFAGDAPVIVCASGCAATLLEYGRLAGDAGASLARRIRDPAELLADADLPLTRGTYREVVLHVPCTQRNVTGTAAATRRLLGRIPELAVRELPPGCCGAAGENFLTHPDTADALLAPLLESLSRAPPDALVTSNIGCAMHFAAGLRRCGLDTAVLHPASLLADALQSGT